MWSNTTKWLLGLLFVCGGAATAQPIPVPLGPVANDTDTRPPVRRVWARDITTYCQLGWQSLTLAPLNNTLALNGYSPLSGRFRTIGIGTQMKISQQPIFLHTEANIGLGTGTASNGLNTVGMTVSTFRLGMGYRVFQKRGLQVIPHLGVMSMPIKLRIAGGVQTTPTLSSALNNPGASQTTQLNTSAGAIDIGLTVNYRFGIQRLYDDCTNAERSLVLAFDGGYRIGSQPEFLMETNPVRRVGFSSSGWYLGIRLGAGLRTDRAKTRNL
jgi:hypothetical protein